MEAMSKTHGTDIDRFSSLPDHIAHHVLSFLSMEDISRLCVVSKTCRELCISIPVLTFDALPYRDNAPKRNQLMNYLDRFLLQRKGMDTTHCYINWTIQNNVFEEEYRVISLLHNEVMCKVQQLHVMLEKEGIFTLPPSVLCCGSWKTLTISLRGGILKFPSFIDTFGFSDLRSLSLSSVQINESFGKWVSSYWHFLKYLQLLDISGTESLMITSSSLEILTIFSAKNFVFRNINVSAERLGVLVLDWAFSPKRRELQLSTPKLTDFAVGGSILDLSLKGSLDSLLESAIFFEFLSVANTSASQCLCCFLCGIRNSKVLTINSQCIQLLYRHSHLAICFNRLEKLKIFMLTCNISDELVLGMTSFLRGTPILRCLHIARTVSSHCRAEAVNGETWELQNFEFIHYLSELIIELCIFGRNELELVKHLLKHADNLLRIDIYSPTLESPFIASLAGCEKASVKVEIRYFVENNLILNLKMEKMV